MAVRAGILSSAPKIANYILCFFLGHRDVEEIDGLDPHRMPVHGAERHFRLGFGGRVRSSHLHCLRCQRDVPAAGA